MQKTFLLILTVIVYSCNGKAEKSLNIAKEVEIKIDTSITPKFISQIKEPWDDLSNSRLVFSDFDAEYAIKGDKLEKANPKDVQIVDLVNDEELELFLEKANTFENLEGLSVVNANITVNKFNEIIEKLIDKQYFQKLILYHCQIKTVPSSISKLKHLRTVALSRNSIASLPNEIGKLTELRYINLYNNRSFNRFPDAIGFLTKLEELGFAGTKVSQLPKTIGNCKNLIKITANACRINELPEELGNCEKLKDINLGYNQISVIPSTLGKLKNLKNLGLGGNNLSNLPKELENLDKLESLMIDGNNFENFPNEVLDMDKLASLWIHKNNITTIPIEITKKRVVIYADKGKINQNDIQKIREIRPNISIYDPIINEKL